MDELRSKVIRLAHSNPEIREDLLPILSKTAAKISGPVDAKASKAADFFSDFFVALKTHLIGEGLITETDGMKVRESFFKNLSKSLTKTNTFSNALLMAGQATIDDMEVLARSRSPVGKEAEGPVALVTVYGGKVLPYKRSEIEEMLTPEGEVDRIYRSSDNLPKWLVYAGMEKVKGFPRNFKDAALFLQKILANPKPVKINVRSDNRWENSIEF